jgi:ribosomal protein L23
MNDYDVIKYPLTTEKSVRLMESENKIIFVVHTKSNKKDVKKAFETLFNAKAKKINIHNQKGRKIAIVTLHPDFNAMDIATQLGML